MLRYFYFKLKHDSYLRNEHGIKKFAEMTMGQLIRRVKKKSAFYREMNENLLVEKANLRLRETELHQNAMLDAGEFFSVKRRLWANSFVIVAIIVAAMFLNYISVSGFIGEAAASNTLKWIVSGVLAIVLTGGGLVVAERLFEASQPRRHHRTKDYPEDTPSVIPLWLVLLIGIELTLLGLAEVRASQLSAAQDSSLLYIGFILLTMMFPILAGVIRWDSMRFIDLYKATVALRAIEGRLAQIDSILRQNEEYESNFYKIRSISAWELLNDFKTHKDNYNMRHGMTENLAGHFSLTYDTFQAEANKRYTFDIRDLTAPSIRKLERVAAANPGGKIGQPIAHHANGGDNLTTESVYLRPQPVR